MTMDSLGNQMSVKVKRIEFTVFGHQFPTVVAKKKYEPVLCSSHPLLVQNPSSSLYHLQLMARGRGLEGHEIK